MPEFIAVRCCDCKLAQSIQKPKSRKFACRVCSTKQSVRQIYATSYQAKDTREVVMRLNMQQQPAEAETPLEEVENEGRYADWNGDEGRGEQEADHDQPPQATATPHAPKRSRWDAFLCDDEEQASSTRARSATHSSEGASSYLPSASHDEQDAFGWMNAVPVLPAATTAPAPATTAWPSLTPSTPAPSRFNPTASHLPVTARSTYRLVHPPADDRQFTPRTNGMKAASKRPRQDRSDPTAQARIQRPSHSASSSFSNQPIATRPAAAPFSAGLGYHRATEAPRSSAAPAWQKHATPQFAAPSRWAGFQEDDEEADHATKKERLPVATEAPCRVPLATLGQLGAPHRPSATQWRPPAPTSLAPLTSTTRVSAAPSFQLPPADDDPNDRAAWQTLIIAPAAPVTRAPIHAATSSRWANFADDD